MAKANATVTRPGKVSDPLLTFGELKEGVLYESVRTSYAGNVYVKIGNILAFFDNGYFGSADRAHEREFREAPKGTSVTLSN